jgi:thymidylate synthase
MEALKRIYDVGFADGINERTGVATKRLPGIVIQVDVEKEFPILKSKKVAGITALREIEWIWKQQSNNIHDLRAHIWDEWADANGSINKAYGFQMDRPICIYTDPVNKTPESFRSYKNQAEYIIEYLREFPNGRWGVATIWNPEELSGMNLVPCCHTSTWNLDGGRLNCLLDQRSGDMPYGVPFNTTQYAELMFMIARDLDVKPGILTHVIADAHIYDRQMTGVKQLFNNYEVLSLIGDGKEAEAFEFAKTISDDPITLFNNAKFAYLNEPEFVINTDKKSFFEYSADQCYFNAYYHCGDVKFGDIVV